MSKELKNEFIKLECKNEHNPEKWAKFLNGYYSDVIKINEYLLPIKKESIEKNFCFGAGMYASASQEELNQAFEEEKNAQTNENYFLNENLKGINNEIAVLNYFLIDWQPEEWQKRTEYAFKNNMYTKSMQKIFLMKQNDYECYYTFLNEENQAFYEKKA